MAVRTPTDPSRRRLLLRALIGIAAGGLGGCAATLSTGAAADRPGQWLGALVGDGAGMTRFGRAYLAQFPAEGDLDLLWAALHGVLARQGAEPSGTIDPERAFGHLDRVVRDEYRRGVVVDVDGWLLSRSEARLYAAATLL